MALFPANEAPQPIAPHGINKWSLSSRIFHWISVVLLIVTWAMIELNEDATDFTYFDLHKAFGLSVLFWTVGRIINRFVTKAPADVPMPKWQNKLSHLTHLTLYLILLAMPLAGWFSVMFDGEGVSMFGLFDIPAFVSENSDWSDTLEKIHKNLLWTLLLVFTGLHIIGALYHQFIQKDHLIRRMR